MSLPLRASHPTASVRVDAPVSQAFSEILTPDAVAFVALPHREFDARRRELLQRRRERQKEFDAGRLPDFLPETRAIRESEWTIAAQPSDLLDRRVEIT